MLGNPGQQSALELAPEEVLWSGPVQSIKSPLNKAKDGNRKCLFFIVWRLTFFCCGVALAARDLLMAAWATAAAAFVESAEK